MHSNEKRQDLSLLLRQLAQRYAEAAQQVLGDNLTSVVLFGSVARSEAGPKSDIDLLVICRELPAGAFRRQEVLEPVRKKLQAELDRLLDQEVYVDFAEIVKSKTEARMMHYLYLDMTEEAISLFDRNSFFARILERLRGRLRELGAERKQLGQLRYWDLKPDFKPGEVIRL